MNLKNVNKDVWLLVLFIFPVVTFVSCGIYNENRKYSGERCSERVAQEFTAKNPSLSYDNFRNYQVEVSRQCD